MALGDNTNLFTVAEQIFITTATPGSDSWGLGSLGKSTVFIFDDGNVGDDLLAFESMDSVVTHKKIYDSNDDGYIWFGDNGVLDIDRTSKKNAGADQITLTGDVNGLRFLGNKTGTLDYVYADAYTRTKLEAAKGTVTEGTVGDDTFDASTGKKIFLYDNALGLNLGGDTITGFGKDDVLVTTVAIFDSNNDGIITFGKNKVLDLAAGEGNPTVDGADVGPGGQISFGGTPTSLIVGATEVIDGVTYHYYHI